MVKRIDDKKKKPVPNKVGKNGKVGEKTKAGKEGNALKAAGTGAAMKKKSPALKKTPAAKKKKSDSVNPKPPALEQLIAPSEADYLKILDDRSDKDDRLDMVAFYLDENLFAVEVNFVGAVIRSREVVELPHTPDFIDGLISVRGEMILVMNLKRRLGMEQGTQSGGNIIVTEPSLTGSKAGMVVDRMAGVMEVDADLKLPKTSSGGKDGDKFIKGVALSDGKKPIKVLDMMKLMDFEMPAGAA